ncbi:MAG: TaqI-like C-terminal specificity domain-containing protein [Syntrophaceae bacterium]|nr:TaqI-like C-terminal specificity domain-containing protein [Syntrophaceae bacterium]
MSDVPQSVLELVEKFERNIDEYKNPRYNETLIRVEFVNPFFKELGWDVYNEKGRALAYRDVIHEDEVKVGGATKAPDYSFRIGGTRKFFVETKKPSVNLKTDPAAAFQLRRYAYSARLPISILTDFEEFIVYNCRAKPSITDKPSADRILCISFRDYAEKWDEISSVFHRESILRGSFDRYVKDTKGKRGTAEIDRDFLADLDRWRLALAQNFALRNPSLTVRELNFAVQMTIDRLIFLRMCEDRGIETYGQLEALVNGAGIYPRLVEIYRKADDRYNSGLFHFTRQRGDASSPDALTPGLKLDDRVVKDIIRNLYYPKCPYEFSLLPVEVLGNAYEQFLGKTIRLTAGHQAKIEEKPEVRKAGGVYYTPEYIVTYIVQNTVGRLLEGKTPREAAGIRILDPACGSGSFLLGAYRCLLDWHLDWYKKEMERTGTLPTVPPPKGTRKRKSDPGAVFQGQGGGWLLTTAEKKRILLNNIYGVDIDQQAVEVTKLSLLLRVLEDENQDTLNKQLMLWRERALPDLGGNIKCGNSLIGPDFFDGQLFPDEEEVRRVNPFDWQAEFPEIMKAGGFDAVIGNPPYGATLTLDSQKYLQIQHPQAKKFPDTYCYFIVKASQLTNNEGFISFIVPNTFCDIESCNEFRKWLLTFQSVESLWQTGWAFKSAIVDTVVFTLRNLRSSPNTSLRIIVDGREYLRSLSDFLENQHFKIDYRNNVEDKNILLKISEHKDLGTLAIVKAGVKLYEKGKGNPPQTERTLQDRPYNKLGGPMMGWRSLYRGEHVRRYFLAKSDEFVNYGPWLAAPRSEDLFLSPKILMRRTSDKLFSCIDTNSSICVNSCHVIKFKNVKQSLSYYYLLGLLNSSLLQKVFEIHNPQMVGKVFAEVKVIYVERLPIRTIDFDDPADRARHDRMVALVEQMLALHKELPAAATDHEETLIRRRIEATDRKIDALVYELYGLTPEEIAVVEGSVH